MKALSLTQPWAHAIAMGAKQYETRSWSTSYRGALAIHAAKGFPQWAQQMCMEAWLMGILGSLGNPAKSLPRGAIIAVVSLLGCRPTEDYSCHRWNEPGGIRISEQECMLGDWTPGRFAWQLADVQPLGESIPCRGALGLWDVPAEIVTEIQRQTGALA